MINEGMAVLRRRRVILIVGLASVLVYAAVLSTYYTAQDHRVIVSGDGPLIINDDVSNNPKTAVRMQKSIFDNYTRSDVTDTEEAMLQSIEAKMELRRKRLDATCSELKKNGLKPPNQFLYKQEDFKHLIVSSEKQVLYCYLPKVANTNFRRVFLGLQGVVPKPQVPSISGYEVYFTYDKKFSYLSRYSKEVRSELLQKYRKFIFVRDPLERLLSGYRNKFFHPNPTHKAEYHQKAAEFYKRHPDALKKSGISLAFPSREMNFKEFLIYWTDVFKAKEYLNEHFIPSNQLCNPCNIKYDYIGKYENLYSDAKYIFAELNIDIEFPGRNDNYSSISTQTLVETFYKPMPAWLLRKTWDIIKFDYLIFGYQLPQWFKAKMLEL